MVIWGFLNVKSERENKDGKYYFQDALATEEIPYGLDANKERKLGRSILSKENHLQLKGQK